MITAGDSVGAVIRTSRRLADGREILYFDSDARRRGTRSTPATSRRWPRAPSCAGTRCWASGWPSPRTGRPAPSCRRPTSARWTRPGPAARPRSRRAATRSWSSRTGSRRWRPRSSATCRRRRRATRWPSCARASGGARSSASPTSTTGSFADLGAERARLVVDAWADRTEALGAHRRRRVGLPVREPRRGDRGDAVAPPRPDLRLPLPARRGRRRSSPRSAGTGRPPAATCSPTSSRAERSGPRVVAANEHWTAFVPAAARWPYEVQLFPHRKVPDLPRSTDAERDALRRGLPRRAARASPGGSTRRCPTSPPGTRRRCGEGREDWWLHLQLFSLPRAPGKMKYLAGSESGMGAFITDTNPEDVAEQLRAVNKWSGMSGRRARSAAASPSGSAPRPRASGPRPAG